MEKMSSNNKGKVISPKASGTKKDIQMAARNDGI